MTDTQREIARVKKAMSETTSPHLKRDYGKYLKKLYKRLQNETKGGCSRD